MCLWRSKAVGFGLLKGGGYNFNLTNSLILGVKDEWWVEEVEYARLGKHKFEIWHGKRYLAIALFM